LSGSGAGTGAEKFSKVGTGTATGYGCTTLEISSSWCCREVADKYYRQILTVEKKP
jgi:hypothetical protein